MFVKKHKFFAFKKLVSLYIGVSAQTIPNCQVIKMHKKQEKEREGEKSKKKRKEERIRDRIATCLDFSMVAPAQ